MFTNKAVLALAAAVAVSAVPVPLPAWYDDIFQVAPVAEIPDQTPQQQAAVVTVVQQQGQQQGQQQQKGAVTVTAYQTQVVQAAATQPAAASATAASTPVASVPSADNAGTSGSSSGSTSGLAGILDNFLDPSFMSKWNNFFGVDSSPSKSSASNSASSSSPASYAPPSSSSENNKSFWDDLFDFGDNSSSSPAPAGTSTPSTASSGSPSTPSTPSSSSSVPSSSPSGGGDITEGGDANWNQNMLDIHNKLRAKHGSPSMVWSDAAYQFAKNMADKYDCSGNLVHSHAEYGENLAAGYDGVDAVQAWYDEGSTYQYGTEDHYDHFTQVVWKGSTQLGCARKDCSSNNWGHYIVCEYIDAGNVIGQSKANVPPPIS